MLFSGLPFLYFFLPAVLLLYLAAPLRWKNGVLLFSSLFFYAWGEQKLVLLFAAAILFNWIIGLLIDGCSGKSRSKAFLGAAVLADLGLLCYFKYADFFLSGVNAVFGTRLPFLQAALPIGISFYTFQMISYVADVYRKKVPAQKNLVDFGAYVSMFPQLIAGPIVRYADVAGQLEGRKHTLDKTAEGIRRFILGLGKKVLIANVLGQLCVQFRSAGQLSVLYYWMYGAAFMLQIYFDFSGYSDMAIGLGRIFGFTFMENFNYPYIAGSITEFWRRWHISLGSWFRDYVYIPLGGNRLGIRRQIFNILLVWTLTGLWHGAAWNFVLWGLFYGLLLILEKLWLLPVLDRHPAVGHIYVLLSVFFGFILFNGNGLEQILSDLSGLFAFHRLPVVSAEALYYLRSYGITLLAGAIGATPLLKLVMKKLSRIKKVQTVLCFLEPAALVCLLLLCTAYLVDGSFNPFLYFRF